MLTDKLMVLYNSFIHPHLLYCNLIWVATVQNQGVLSHLLIFQKKIARIMLFAPLKLGPKVHAAPLMHKLRMLTIFEICQLQQVCLAHSIINNNSPNLQIQLTYVCNTNPYQQQKSRNKQLRTHRAKN
eukprot:Lithocolla_globosa_v1_NODE_1609_length_2451_cov_124.224311.p1 type:complete len:128 gc:universal NODE_1609_length_2451_cov_124.224311:903-520(-)